jgi:hypothetical protein
MSSTLWIQFEFDLVAKHAVGELACTDDAARSGDFAERLARNLNGDADEDLQAQADLQLGGGAHDQEVRGNTHGFAGVPAGGSPNAEAKRKAGLPELGKVIREKSHGREG